MKITAYLGFKHHTGKDELSLIIVKKTLTKTHHNTLSSFLQNGVNKNKIKKSCQPQFCRQLIRDVSKVQADGRRKNLNADRRAMIALIILYHEKKAFQTAQPSVRYKILLFAGCFLFLTPLCIQINKVLPQHLARNNTRCPKNWMHTLHNEVNVYFNFKM